MILIHVLLLLLFDDDDLWLMVIVGAVDDNISLKPWPLFLGISHGNPFIEAAEDMLCS